MDETTLFRVAVTLLEVEGTEILVVGVSLEQVIGDHQDGMADGDGGSTLAAPGCQASVECREVGVALPRGRMGGLDQERPQPGTALARLPTPPFARALVVAGAHPGPGREVVGAGEARHIGP